MALFLSLEYSCSIIYSELYNFYNLRAKKKVKIYLNTVLYLISYEKSRSRIIQYFLIFFLYKHKVGNILMILLAKVHNLSHICFIKSALMIICKYEPSTKRYADLALCNPSTFILQ